VENVARDHTFHHIRPIKTVHTVSAHNTFLGRLNFALFRIDFLCSIQANVDFTNEMTPVLELF